MKFSNARVLNFPIMRQTDELLDYLFDKEPHPMASSMEEWLTSSRRFTAFVDTFRDKIRKKIRVTQDQESLLDLQLELETAYLLLGESRFSLVYEPQLAEKVRGPDFAVMFTTSLTFMLEVTRLRADYIEEVSDTTPTMERFADAVCSKLGQMQNQVSNVLIVGAGSPNFAEGDLRAIMLRIQQRAEKSDMAFFHRYGFRDRSDFFRYYQRLSEILVRTPNANLIKPVAYINIQAKYPLPSKVRTVLYHSQTT